jgi:hypothetical protein
VQLVADDDEYLAEAQAAKAEDESGEDRLVRLRKGIALMRAKVSQLAVLNEARDRLDKEIKTLKTKTLVDGMVECRMTYLELAAEDDYPAVSASLEDFFSAKIPEGGEVPAFEYLEGAGFEESIKNAIMVANPTGEVRASIVSLCLDTNTDYIEKRTVHPQTLLKIVRELYKARKLVDTEKVKPTLLLGAYVGQVVKLTAKE